MLKRYGWHVECISIHQPLGILAYAERKPTDILIVDIRLYSSRNRFQDVIDILKADPTAKIIGVSAYYDEKVSETLKGLGASGYFYRNMPPIEIVDVLSCVSMDKYGFPIVRNDNNLNTEMAKGFVYDALNTFSNEKEMLGSWL
jgi:DNA-binding NarL/FixJ family response regulator